MAKWEQLVVNIKEDDSRATGEYSCDSREKRLSHKIERAIKQYKAQGWKIDSIEFHEDGTTVRLYQTNA